MAILATVSTEELDYAQHVGVEEFGRRNPTLYFESYGPTRLIGGRYKVVTYLSLEEYNKKYETLGAGIANLAMTCEQAAQSFLCANYHDVLTHLYNEITDQREKMYSSLGKPVDGTVVEEEDVRRKRGLMNFMGTGMNYLFGVCDDDCTTKANDAIERTEKNGNNVLHIMKQQTTVVKAAMKQLTTGINETQTVYRELREKERVFIQGLQLIGNTTEGILNLLNSNAIQNMYTLLTNQYAYETATLNQIVTAARAGVIHSSLMTISDIANIMKKVKTRVDRKQLELPMGTKPSEVYELLKVIKMTVYYGNNRIVFITKIPLVTSTELVVYNVIPIPVRRSEGPEGIMQILDPEAPYVAITKDRREYAPITSEQMEKCIETNIYRICPSTIQLLTNSLDNNSTSPCEVYLFSEPKEIKAEETRCKTRTASLKRSLFHKLRYTNDWIFSVKNDWLIITCVSMGGTVVRPIQGEGMISIHDRECRIRTTNGVLEPDEEISATTYINFIPKTDMTKLFEKLPNNTQLANLKHLGIHHDIKFTDMRQATRSLEEVENMISVEQERQQNYVATKQHSTMLYITMGLVAFSMILILIIYIMVKCQHTHRGIGYASPYAMQPMLPIQATAPPSPR